MMVVQELTKEMEETPPCEYCKAYSWRLCTKTPPPPLYPRPAQTVLDRLGWIYADEVRRRHEVWPEQYILDSLNSQIIDFYYYLCHADEVHGRPFRIQQYCEYQWTKLKVKLIDAGYFPGGALTLWEEEEFNSKGAIARSKISKTNLVIQPIDGNAAKVVPIEFTSRRAALQ